MKRLAPTWPDRDYPVLLAVVELLEDSAGEPVSAYQLGARLGMEDLDVARALNALDGEFIDRISEGVLDGSPELGVIFKVTPAARRAVGQWPTPESLADELVATLDERITQEAEPERRSRLERVRDAVGGTTRDLFVEVAGSVLSRAVTGA